MPSKTSLRFVSIDSNAKAVSLMIENNVSQAITQMANAIRTNSRMVAPKKDNHLRSSVNVSGDKFKKVVSYGQGLEVYGKGYNYAAYQENKEMTPTSRYTTPGTHSHFLEQAGDAVVKQGIGVYLNKIGRNK